MTAIQPSLRVRGRSGRVLPFLLLLLTGCAHQAVAPGVGPEAGGDCDDPKPPTWDYEHQDEWHLQPDAELCATGRNQSPLLLTGIVASGLQPITLDYRGRTTVIEYLKHDIEVRVAGESFLNVDGKRFRLQRFHFHTPSESEVPGIPTPIEAHFVHEADDGEAAVLAVLYSATGNNTAITTIQENMPRERGCRSFEVPVADLTRNLLPPPTSLAYYRFSGSLTTPPCAEGLRWLVLQASVQASTDQAKAFSDVTGENARDLQKLWARRIFRSSGP